MRRLIFAPPHEYGLFERLVAEAGHNPGTIRIDANSPLGPALVALARDRLANRFSDGEDASIEVFGDTDGESLAPKLAALTARRNVTVIAPVTDRFWDRRSLFLISIPKSGTHLLMELARAFGYKDGGECPAQPKNGHWHYLEFTNSHTAAPDFFIDTVRRQPHGNRDHAFRYNPSLFIYRNPLDIVASEANYYHEDGATVFAGYLDTLNYEERLLRLIDDPWLLGSIRDRVGKFAAWLEVSSVIPVSFEELVGPDGGGEVGIQEDLIWSLMLRLNVPGQPADIAGKIFNPNSPTFRFGRIGGHEKRFTPQAWEKVRALRQDFMAVYGFDQRPVSGPWLPSRTKEFRRRVPRYSKADMRATPILIRENVLGHNIVRYRGRVWAVPQSLGDIAVMPDATLSQIVSADELSTLEFMLQASLIAQYNRRHG